MYLALANQKGVVSSDAIMRATDFFEHSIVDTVPSVALCTAFVEALLQHAFGVDEDENKLTATHAMTTQALTFLKATPLLERPSIAADHGFISDLLSAALSE